MLGLSIGTISTVYHLDSGSVKNSIRWLLRLVAGDSDSQEEKQSEDNTNQIESNEAKNNSVENDTRK